jgi:DNA-binding NtrC family response regulator
VVAPLSLLLVEDERDLRALLDGALRHAGHRVTAVADGAQALELVLSRVFDVVVCDVRLPKMDGITLFRRIRLESPATDVILVTGYAAVAEAVSALKSGASDYLTKPLDLDELVVRLERIAEQRALRRELDDSRARLSNHDAGIIGCSPAIVRLHELVDTIAGSDAPVLITGESGTGKELVARTLHERGARRAGPFVAVNCAAFPDTLIEAELFGHERGAFTGAIKRRDGRFKAADGGTVLLDEVAELPLQAQAKLLRVLQEGTIEPLGTNTTLRVDVRVISATHRNLKERIAAGLFREDLYYRLMVLDVEIPPLRERRSDVPLLLQHFLQRFAPVGQQPPSISPAALAVLSHYPYPGNVRELAHAVEHAIVLSRGRSEIGIEHLPSHLVGTPSTSADLASSDLRPLGVALREFEREYLVRALERVGGKRTRAAELLGISRKNLWEKIRAHGIGGGSDGEPN